MINLNLEINNFMAGLPGENQLKIKMVKKYLSSGRKLRKKLKNFQKNAILRPQIRV